MRPGMQPLLALLRDEPLGDVPAAEWTSALHLAEQENLLPWAAARLREAVLPDAQLALRLRQIHRDARAAAFLFAATLKTTLAAFDRKAIPVIALKGPSLAERLYGDVALRNYSDLDLLVRRSDLPGAEHLLTALGFTPADSRGDFDRVWHRGGIRIELHHALGNPLSFDFPIAEIWRRARPASFHGEPVCLLAPADELLFLCLHGVRHRFERLSLTLDLALALRCWPQHAAAAQQNPAAAPVLAIGARMAAHLDPRLALPHLPRLGDTDREAIAALADRLWQELLLRPAPAFGLRAKHRFYLALETRPAGRARTRLRNLGAVFALIPRVAAADRAFAARFRLRHTWQARLLRPLRLLLNAGRDSPRPAHIPLPTPDTNFSGIERTPA